MYQNLSQRKTAFFSDFRGVAAMVKSVMGMYTNTSLEMDEELDEYDSNLGGIGYRFHGSFHTLRH